MVTLNETGRTSTAAPNPSNVRPTEAEALHAHEGLIRAEARRFRTLGEIEDRMQEGRLAAVLAIRTYREGHGTTLTSWIWRCVRNRYCQMLAAETAESRTGVEVAGDRNDGADERDLRPAWDRLASTPPPQLAEAIATEQADALGRALTTLDPREHRILRRRYAEDATLAEVGADIGCTRERVRQVEQVALEKLRMRMRAAGVAA